MAVVTLKKELGYNSTPNLKGIVMSQCKVCSKECKGSTCSGACRAKLSRRTRTVEPGAHAAKRTVKPNTHYITLSGTVYGRQEVKYSLDQYATRPEPLSTTDTPHSGGRGKFTRQDGTEYQFDCTGHTFDLTAGKVYATAQEVRECYTT